MVFAGDRYEFAPSKDVGRAQTVYTDWTPITKPSDAQELFLQLDEWPSTEEADPALLVAIGLDMGMPVSDRDVRSVQHMGCGKILQTS